MRTVRKSIVWRLCVSVVFVVPIIAVSLGAQSVAFHQFVHGDDVVCSLTHPGHEGEGASEDSTEAPDHGHPDPLESFCQPGHLLGGSFLEVVLEQPSFAALIEQSSFNFVFLRFSSSDPSRAPPVLI